MFSGVLRSSQGICSKSKTYTLQIVACESSLSDAKANSVEGTHPKGKRHFVSPETIEFMKTYNLTAPAWNHTDNADCHFHQASPHWNKALYVMFPLLAYFGYKTYEHEKHVEEHIDEIRPEFRDMDYLRVLKTPYPWGDGKHTLFHNPKRNPIRGVGYEE